MSQKVHVMHGRDHLCGGADEIPGICDFISGSGLGSYRACIEANPDLLAYWPAGEASGDLVDVTSGIHLAPTPKTITGTSYPTYGNAGAFDGTFAVGFAGTAGAGPDDHDLFAGTFTSGQWAAAFLNRHAWTIEMWIYPTAVTSPTGGFLLDLVASGTQKIALSYNTSNQLGALRGSTIIGNNADTVVPLDTWVNVRLSYDGTNFNIYLNGSLQDTDVSTTDLVLSTITVGNSTIGRAPFNGRITDLSILTVASSTFCPTVTADGPGTTSDEGDVLTADGAGGTDWLPATIRIDSPSGRYDTINLGSNLTGTDEGDGSVTIDAASATPFDPATATTWWFPLFDSDGTAVLDGDGNLIPTLVPL